MQNQDTKEYSGVAELIDIENNLKNYNSFLVSMFAKSLKDIKLIYDFGAGIGTLSDLYRMKTGYTPVCIELDTNLHARLESRKLSLISDIGSIEGKIEGLFTSNVMEHIEDDQDILNQIFAKMDRGSKLVIYVPAFFMCLFSDLDKSVGHYRRYEKQELINKVSRAGFKINQVNYVDSIGFFASLLFVIKARFRKGHNIAMPVSPAAMNFYDRFVFPFSRLLDFMGLRFLFGKNLYLEAKKK